MSVDNHDLFEVIGKIPSGLAYQWCPLSVLGDEKLARPIIDAMKRGGWMPVPAKRHPKMPSTDYRIIVAEQILVQKPKRLISDGWIADARELAREAKSSPVVTAAKADEPYYSLEAVDAILEKLKAADDGRFVAEFTINVGLALTRSEIETSLYLSLTPSEYARRQFFMADGHLCRVSAPQNTEHTPIFAFVTMKRENI